MEPLDKKMVYSYIPYDMRSRLVGLEIFEKIDSTNNYLLDRASASGNGFYVCFAESQTGGKGRQGGRIWVSPRCGSIYMSVMHTCSSTFMAWLGLMAAIEVTSGLHALGGNSIGIKWPNDIYCPAGKLGGVLVECKGGTYVIGIGVNLYLPKEIMSSSSGQMATLDEVMTINVSRNVLAAVMTEAVMKAFDYINQAVDADKLIARFQEFDLLYDKTVQVVADNQGPVQGIASGITPSAGLRVRHKDSVQIYHSAQVRVSL